MGKYGSGDSRVLTPEVPISVRQSGSARRQASRWAQITVADLPSFIESLIPARVLIGSQARTLAAVRSLLRFALTWGYIKSDLARAVVLPRYQPKLAERYMEESEVECLLSAAGCERDGVLFRLLYFTGMRVSEVCGLCWRDFRSR
jgi:integrase/recombinase XerD